MIACVDTMTGAAKVLIIDDEPNVRLVFRTALESSGYQIAEAESGVGALLKLQTYAADVLLLDLQMPGMGGMEVLRELREAGNRVPVVIITAHGSIPDAVAAMKLGAIDFLTKPLTPNVLRGVVAEVLARHASDDPEAEHEAISHVATHVPAVAVAPSVVDLTAVKQALNGRDFERAARLLETVLDTSPESAEALTLMGVLHECRGQDHAAYHAYKKALTANPRYGPARDNMTRYCRRFNLDDRSKSINPAAEE